MSVGLREFMGFDACQEFLSILITADGIPESKVLTDCIRRADTQEELDFMKRCFNDYLRSTMKALHTK